MKQSALFAEPRFRRVCRDEILPAGLYSPSPVIVAAIVGLTPSDKAVYRAALHHLRGAATSVSVGLDRMAAMAAMSRRSAAAGVARLHAAVLIDAWRRRPGGLWRIAFAPLDWWLAEHGRSFDPGLIERLLDIYTGESAITRFVEAARQGGAGRSPAVAPTPTPAETAPTSAAPAETAPASAAAAPEAAAPETAPRPQAESAPPPSKNFQNVENSAPPHADFSTIQENSAPKALTKTDLTSAARAAQRSISNSQSDAETDSLQGRSANLKAHPSLEIAEAWEDLLGLSAKARTDEQEDNDFQALLDVAADVLKGDLGPVEAAKDALYTLAHQIGHRPTPARTPLGLFLADGVGKLRIKAMRRTAVSKKGAENG